MKIYRSSIPYFSKSDIKDILPQFEKILKGEGLMTKGPKVKQFEKRFSKLIGSKYGVAVNSGTSALEIAVKSLKLNFGDEVIVPTQTFVSTASSVLNNGAIPIFCNINDNHLLDFDDLKNKITKKTKAVIIVHFAGLIDPQIFLIKKYLKDRNIYLIEDAAHAHGAKIDKSFAGTIGDIGCFSFYSTKIITTGGEGGFITCKKKFLYNLCSSLCAIGIDKTVSEEIYTNPGSNNRMNEFQAILGISQLSNMNDFIDHRMKIAKWYSQSLKSLYDNGKITFQSNPKNIIHPYWMFLVFVQIDKFNRDSLKTYLAKKNIYINWPYQPLLHKQPVFKKLKQFNDFERSEHIARKHINLPIHLKIQKEDVEYISDIIIRYFSQI